MRLSRLDRTRRSWEWHVTASKATRASGSRRCDAAPTSGRRSSAASPRCTWAARRSIGPDSTRAMPAGKSFCPTYPFQRERFWVDVAPEVKRPEKEQTIPVRVSEMLHDIVWREGPPAGRPMAAAGVVRSIVSPRIAEIARESGLEAFEPFGPALDRLATSYIVRALRGLGADLRVGTEFLASELADRLGVLPRHRRLFERLAADSRRGRSARAAWRGMACRGGVRRQRSGRRV